MNTEALNEAAEKYADNIISQVDFIAGVTSNAAKEYWYKQFQDIEKIGLGFYIRKGDEVNSFLIAAMRGLNEEQKIALRDALIERTPKSEQKQVISDEEISDKIRGILWKHSDSADEPEQSWIDSKDYEKVIKEIKSALQYNSVEDGWIQKPLQQLIEWHTKFDVPFRTQPDPVDDSDENLSVLRMRARIMKEEVKEWESAALYNLDIDKRAKELADILYTVFGTIITEGLQDVIERVFNEVHKSNMSKLGNDGKPIKRADGKVLKGENYKEPDLSWLIKQLK